MISVTFAVRPSIIGPHLFPCHTSFMNSTESTALRFEQLTYEVSLHQNIGQDRLFREWTEDAQDCNSRPAVSYLHSFFLEQNIQSLRCCPSSKRVMQGRHAIRNPRRLQDCDVHAFPIHRNVLYRIETICFA